MRNPLTLLAEKVMLKEILDAQTERLIREGDGETYARLFPPLRDWLAPLVQIGQVLEETLVPVRPDEVFRENLRAGLMTAARQRMVPCPDEEANRPWRPARGLVIGAAVGSAISVVGVAAFLIRRAALTHQQAAGSDAA